MNRSGEIRITKTTVGVWEEDVDESMRETLPFVAAHFTARGWAIGADPRIDRDYPSLSRSHLAGGKAELGVYVRLCGRHLEINITTDGNRLLSDTTQAMAKSPTLRLRVLCEIASLARTLVDCGYRISARNGFHSRPVEPTLATVRNIVEGRKGTPLEQFNEDWGDNRFERDESGWPALKELTSWNKDGLTQGAWRYGRTSNGRLVYGQTFGGINERNSKICCWKTL
jgi:hypothetical protein